MSEDTEMTFESALERLQKIVAALESGEMSLEQSLALYKEGHACALFCREKLQTARHELEIWQGNEALAVAEIAEDEE